MGNGEWGVRCLLFTENEVLVARPGGMGGQVFTIHRERGPGGETRKSKTRRTLIKADAR
jgi:hypothetical protein